MATFSKVIVLLSTGISVTVLFFSLRRAAREIRIRPLFEWARILVGVGGAVVLGLIVGTQTPPLLAFGAVLAGALVGYYQGQQLAVTLRDDKLWAKRTILGIMLWSVGLIGMQLAGLGTRTGVFRLGQAISLFSVSIALGVVIGRTGPEKLARKPVLATVGTAALLAVIVGGLSSEPAVAQQEPFPWVYEGTGIQHAEHELNFGAGHSYSLDNELEMRIVLNADGTIEYTSISSPATLPTVNCTNGEIKFHPNENPPYVLEYWGTHADGVVVVETAGTLTFPATYDETEIVGGYEYSGSDNCSGGGPESWFGSVSFRLPRVSPVATTTTLAPITTQAALTTQPPVTTLEVVPIVPLDTSPSAEDVASGTSPEEDAITSDEDGPVAGGAVVALADDEVISDEEAIGVAVAAAITALVMAGLTLAEAGQAVTEMFGQGGSDFIQRTYGGSSGAALLPPVLDENGEPMLISTGSELDANGEPVPAGRVRWDAPGEESVWISREDAAERVQVERIAIASRDEHHERIVADQLSDDAAGQRLDELFGRSVAENDERMRDIRAGWDRVDELGAQIDERERVLSSLEVAEADQVLATMRDSWGQIFSETAQASWDDATEIPGILVDATRVVVQALADPENWQVLGEATAETIYDAAGMMTGGAFGDGFESVGKGGVTAARVSAALVKQLATDPLGTVAMFIPGRDLYDALDGDRSLGQRLGSVGIGVLDIGATLVGIGVMSHADDLVDAARVMDMAEEAVSTARVVEVSGDAAGVARAVDLGGTAPARMAEATRLVEVAEEARVAARAAISSGNSADIARTMDTATEAERAAEAARRSLFKGRGMQAMGRAEAAGSVSDELAQNVIRIHDDITGAASRQGVVDAVEDFAAEVGFRPREVMMGNSGRVGAGRSVLTDADRTIVASFSREQLQASRTAGESLADTQRRLQARLGELHQRSSELALNSPTDPAVLLARQEGIDLGEAVARLGDADDPAAAAVRLTGSDMDMKSYAGFGAGAGQADAYPMGYTRARQATHGSTEVFTFGEHAGDTRSYSTSGQAILDRNELGQVDLQVWDSELQQLERSQGLNTPLANAPDVDTAWGVDRTLNGLDSAADPTRIANAEMSRLFEQQQLAMGNYNNVTSISKAVDRASYVAGRIRQPLPNPRLTEAARTIRANPRAAQAVLSELGMSEPEFVSSLQQMMSSYQPVFPS